MSDKEFSFSFGFDGTGFWKKTLVYVILLFFVFGILMVEKAYKSHAEEQEIRRLEAQKKLIELEKDTE